MPASLEQAQTWAEWFAQQYPGVTATALVGKHLMLTAVMRDGMLRRGARWIN